MAGSKYTEFSGRGEKNQSFPPGMEKILSFAAGTETKLVLHKDRKKTEFFTRVKESWYLRLRQSASLFSALVNKTVSVDSLGVFLSFTSVIWRCYLARWFVTMTHIGPLGLLSPIVRIGPHQARCDALDVILGLSHIAACHHVPGTRWLFWRHYSSSVRACVYGLVSWDNTKNIGWLEIESWKACI